jgi:RNA polymerase sigma factor (sigma-70 family)
MHTPMVWSKMRDLADTRQIERGARGSERSSGFSADIHKLTARRIMTTDKPGKVERFEGVFVAHLDAAYNLARWLTRDDSNAEDIAQEACLRAFRFIDGFHGENGRAWLLAIVRNTYYSWLEKNRPQAQNVSFDEETLGADDCSATGPAYCDVDYRLQQDDYRRLINGALDRLPAEFREVIVLRELEEMSYKEIAAIANIPLGTVMSRLARARQMLLRCLQQSGQGA